MDRYLAKFNQCMEKEVPYCTAVCPFHMDIPDFVGKLQRGAFKAAFKIYRDAVGYPEIANFLCEASCGSVCVRKEAGGALSLRLLERAAMDYAEDISATDYNIPMKKKRIAIIGGGIGGMAALVRLSTKKYQVELFEKSSRLGGALWDRMPPALFLEEFERQLAHQQYVYHLNTEITSPEELEEFSRLGGGEAFDAVFVATGRGGADLGLLAYGEKAENPYCMKRGETGYFAGGALIGEDPLHALANGLAVGTVIDNFLKTGNLYYPKNILETRLEPGMLRAEETAPVVIPGCGKCKGLEETSLRYTREEAVEEARRCILCHCNACKVHCSLVEFVKKWPQRIKDEIVFTTVEGKSEIKAMPAKRMMSLCNQCGLCKDVCPQEIDLDGLFLVGRQKMHKQGKMPWAFHDFWLRDMAQANGSEAALSRSSPGDTEICDYAFFPGCQLPASAPGLVEKAYDALLEKHPKTGLLLQCCGVPAEWAGDQALFEATLAGIREQWEQLGQPVLILACMTCMHKFRQFLPEIPVVSLMEQMDEWGIRGQKCGGAQEYGIFDPCAVRYEAGAKAAVRKLAAEMEIKTVELPENNQFMNCCGVGGHGAIANPAYTDFTVQKRIQEKDVPYLTYCINCHDIFLQKGKENLHILEFMFGRENQDGHCPTVTERQDNRVKLKKLFLEKYWKETTAPAAEAPWDITVLIDDELKEKINRNYVLEKDVIHTIDFCERHQRLVLDTESGIFSGYCKIGEMTHWVEYKKLGEKRFQLVNFFVHRMSIEQESVWNGVRQDTDLR